MPIIQIDDTLRNVIKEVRKERGLAGDKLAKSINKSASYISQVENGSISTMDITILYKIFNEIIDLPNGELPDYLIEIVQKNFKLTKDDIKEKEWLLSLEYQYREFPITDEIVDFMKSKLSGLNITGIDLVKEINRNEDLDDVLLEQLKDANKVLVKVSEDGHVQTSIRFLFKDDFIDKIISREIKTINKIKMKGILYNIYKLEGMNSVDASIMANKQLDIFKFYTMEKRNALIEQAQHDNVDLNEIILKEDNECNSYINKIIKQFTTLRDINPVLGIDIFSNFYNSIDTNRNLMFTLLKMDFSKLKDMSDERKKDFLKEIKQLIDKYSEPQKEDFIL